MQSFRDAAIRERMRRDPASAKYLQRSDYMLKKTGFSTDVAQLKVKRDAQRPCGPQQSIRSIIDQKQSEAA